MTHLSQSQGLGEILSIAVVIITDNDITGKDECFKVKSELADCEGAFTHLQRTGGPAA